MRQFNTPIRRLEGITYWVIEDPNGIYDFINNEVRKEWEEDTRFEGRNPEEDGWLQDLANYRWLLEILDINSITLNPRIMNYIDDEREYVFSEALKKRSNELALSIKKYRVPIWPIIVRKEDYMLMDGYCRYTALRNLQVKRVYTYVGTLNPSLDSTE